MASGTEDGGPFAGIDPKLNIYALANGMDLVKEPDARRLGWYREGRDREVRIALDDRGAGFVVSVSAGGGRDAPRKEAELDRVPTAEALSSALTRLLQRGEERANEL